MAMEYDKSQFELQWFSGTGKGGQHRNKHENCCRLIHLESDMKVTAQSSRERGSNFREAMTRMTGMIAAMNEKKKERHFSDEVVRTYHFERSEVIDSATGIHSSLSGVLNGDLDQFVLHPNRDAPRRRSGRV